MLGKISCKCPLAFWTLIQFIAIGLFPEFFSVNSNSDVLPRALLTIVLFVEGVLLKILLIAFPGSFIDGSMVVNSSKISLAGLISSVILCLPAILELDLVDRSLRRGNTLFLPCCS